MIGVLAREPFVAATTDTSTLSDWPLNAPAELVGLAETLSARYCGRLQEFDFRRGKIFPISNARGLMRRGLSE